VASRVVLSSTELVSYKGVSFGSQNKIRGNVYSCGAYVFFKFVLWHFACVMNVKLLDDKSLVAKLKHHRYLLYRDKQ
jgi:hypothetical protein